MTLPLTTNTPDDAATVARIVEWLREAAATEDRLGWHGRAANYEWAADSIERGDHLKDRP